MSAYSPGGRPFVNLHPDERLADFADGQREWLGGVLAREGDFPAAVVTTAESACTPTATDAVVAVLDRTVGRAAVAARGVAVVALLAAVEVRRCRTSR